MAQQEHHLINSLKENFPEDSWSWVIPALKRTPMIWNQIQSPDVYQYLVQEIGSEPSDWTPARIGAAILKMEVPELINWPIQSFSGLSAEIQDRVTKTYQEYSNRSDQNHNLPAAFLVKSGIDQ